MRIVVLSLALLGLVLGLAGAANAQGRGGGSGMRGGGMGGTGGKLAPDEPYEFFEQKGLFATGLTAVFPTSVDCPGVASPFGSRTRYDGSERRNDHYGYHNGLDITLATRTPLLAMADGTVVHGGTGGQLVGNFVWVHHTPDATGLPVHVFVRYQHLDEPPALAAGTRVAIGDVVGLSGNTGTTGGHYGNSGYAHLHMNLLTGDSDAHVVMGPMLGPKSLGYLDPLGLFVSAVPRPADNSGLRSLPGDRKVVTVSVRTTDGRIVPAGSRVIWPVACRPR